MLSMSAAASAAAASATGEASQPVPPAARAAWESSESSAQIAAISVLPPPVLLWIARRIDWADDVRPKIMFDSPHDQLLASMAEHAICLPNFALLTPMIADGHTAVAAAAAAARPTAFVSLAAPGAEGTKEWWAARADFRRAAIQKGAMVARATLADGSEAEMLTYTTANDDTPTVIASKFAGLTAKIVVDANQNRLPHTTGEPGKKARITTSTKFAANTVVLIEPVFPSAALVKLVHEGGAAVDNLRTPAAWWGPVPAVPGTGGGPDQQMEVTQLRQLVQSLQARLQQQQQQPGMLGLSGMVDEEQALAQAQAQSQAQAQIQAQHQAQQLQAQHDAQAQALAQQAQAQQEQTRQFQQQQQLQLQAFQQQTQAQQQPQPPQPPAPQLPPVQPPPQLPQIPYVGGGAQGQPLVHARPTSAPPGFATPMPVAQGVLQPIPMPLGARGTKRSSADLFGSPVGDMSVVHALPSISAFGLPLPNPVQEAREASIRDAFKNSVGGSKHVGESGMPLDPLNPASLLSDTSHLSMLARLQKLERTSGVNSDPVTIEGYFSESKRAVLNSSHLSFEQKTHLAQLYEQRQADMERSVRKFNFTAEEERWFVEELFMEQSLLSSDPFFFG